MNQLKTNNKIAHLTPNISIVTLKYMVKIYQFKDKDRQSE